MHFNWLEQYFIVAGHLHVPAMQGIPDGQTLPQVPQLFSSLTTSMQAPPQSSWPGGQIDSTHVHVLVSNVWPAGQASWQAALQLIFPGEHPHSPLPVQIMVS